MKRMLLHQVIVIVGCFAVVFPVNAQQFDARPPHADGNATIDQARTDFARAEKKIETLQSVGLSTALPSNRQSLQELREKVRTVVIESFGARQRLQQAELAELRRRLTEIEQSLAERQNRMDAIVDSRVDDLLSGRTGQAVTRVSSRVHGVVVGTGQIGVIDHQGKRGIRGLEIGDKVRAGDLLVKINSREAESSNPAEAVEVLAPIDGVIVERQVNVGVVVKPNDTLFQISSPITGNVTKRTVATLDAAEVPARSADEFLEGQTQVDLQAAQEKYDKALERQSASTSHGEPATADEFDIKIRERLAQVDVEEATAIRDGAQQILDAHVDGNKRAPGSTPNGDIRRLENTVRVAEARVQRAKLTMEGLKTARTEQEAAADALLVEAAAQRQKADAVLAGKVAGRESLLAQLQGAEAELEAAVAKQQYAKKQYERMLTLAENKSVDVQLVDECKDALDAAEAAVTAAKSAVATAKANVVESEAGIDAARADVAIAKARFKTAKARRDALRHDGQTDDAPAAKTPPDGRRESETPADPNKTP